MTSDSSRMVFQMETRTVNTLLTAAILFLFSLNLPFAETCTCTIMHPQDQFCDADFVIKARIRNEDTFNMMGVPDMEGNSDIRYNDIELDQDWSMLGRPIRRYSIKVIKVFKENELFQNVSQEFLYTPASDAGCGVSLTTYTKYLLMGRVLDGVPEITTCVYHSKWSNVSKRIKRDMLKLYPENCDSCKMEICYRPNCMQQKKRSRNDQETDKCSWNPRADPDRCYLSHSACTMRTTANGRGQRCKWVNNKYLDNCLQVTKKQRRQEP